MSPALVDCKLSQLLLIVNQRTAIILLLVGWDARLVLTTKLAKCVGARTSHWAMAIVIAQQVKSIAMWQSALLASLVLTGTKLLKNASVVLSIAIPVKMGFHAWLVRKTTHKHLQIYASVPLPTYTMWLVIVCHPVLKTSILMGMCVKAAPKTAHRAKNTLEAVQIAPHPFLFLVMGRVVV